MGVAANLVSKARATWRLAGNSKIWTYVHLGHTTPCMTWPNTVHALRHIHLDLALHHLDRCDCPRGFTGLSCSEPPSDPVTFCRRFGFHLGANLANCSQGILSPLGVPLNNCLNACNGRGACTAGWCLCDKGKWKRRWIMGGRKPQPLRVLNPLRLPSTPLSILHSSAPPSIPGDFGGDCSLSMGSDGKPQLLAGQGYVVRQRRPLVYIYELPPSFNTYFNLRIQDRPLWFMIYQRLLGR